MPSWEEDRKTARVLLTSVRRAKTADQIESVCATVAQFIQAQREAVDVEVKRLAEDALTPILGPAGSSSALARSGAEGSTVHERLLLSSVLAGAFGRRADSLVSARLLAGGAATAAGEFDLAWETDGRAGPAPTAPMSRSQQRRAALVRLRVCMERLTAALDALEAAAGGVGGDARCGLSWGGGLRTPADAVLSYGAGEVRDLATRQRARAGERLRSLTASAPAGRWNVDAIVETVWEISDFSQPVTAFARAAAAAAPAEADTAETTMAVTPLRDPLSLGVIRTPCRGERCVHVELFDAASFVRSAQQRAARQPAAAHEAGAPCPLCRLFTPIHALRVDAAAVAAMRAHAEAQAAGASAEEGPAGPLSADHCLEWDLAEQRCRVVAGKRRAAEVPGDGEGGDGTATGNVADYPPDAVGPSSIRKRRKVEIGGHVLFVDE